MKTTIAALARQHDLDVLSNDTHFSSIDGIRRMDCATRTSTLPGEVRVPRSPSGDRSATASV